MSVAIKAPTDHSTSLALLLSISPLYFLVQSRAKLGLDGLHIALLQVLLMVVLRFLLSFDPRRARQSSASGTTSAPTVAPDAASPALSTETKRSETRKKRKFTRTPPPVAETLFSAETLDRVAYNFLLCTAPNYTTYLPTPPPTSTSYPSSASLSAWKLLYEAEGLEVRAHPSTKALYSIALVYPDVPLRRLYATLIDVETRKQWDGMCSGVEPLADISVSGRRGSCSWLGMKGMALVKAKDMVLLSVVGRLPPNKNDDALRIFCATSSFDHPLCPPKQEYNRMILNVSGFLVEEHGDGGSKISQITDLSGLGSWIPSSVFSLITQTMIPKSLAKLGRCAAAYELSEEAQEAEGDAWLPPLLGSVDETLPQVDAADSELVEDEDEDDSADEDESKRMTPAASRDLHTLVSEIRTLTTRLTQMESSGAKGWFGTELLTLRKLGLVGAGSAAGAALAVAVLAAWGRRKR